MYGLGKRVWLGGYVNEGEECEALRDWLEGGCGKGVTRRVLLGSSC
jgi:hypothetical protein